MSSNTIDVVGILTKMQNAIELFGWRQHDDGDPKVGFCLMGAARYAVVGSRGLPVGPQHGELMAVTTALRKAIDKTKSRDRYAYSSIVHWNDVRGRTKTQVLALLDRAIAAANS